MPNKPIAEKFVDLTVEEVVTFLQVPSKDHSCVPPVKPKGGEIYIFSPGDEPRKNGGAPVAKHPSCILLSL